MMSEPFAAQWEQMAADVLSGMSGWRQANPTATLTEIERETDRRMATMRARLMAEVAQASAMTEGGDAQARPGCPVCGGTTVRNGKRKRRLTTQHEQGLELERQQLQCQACGHSFFPSR